jgi:hypothetical protein
MRLRTLIKLLALGLAARAAYRYQRSRRTARDAGARWDDFANDPRDPVQGFDEVVELQVSPLEVDALSHEDLEAAQDLAGLASEVDRLEMIDRIAMADADALDGAGEDVELVAVDVAGPRDAGDLYGVHTPPAVDRTHPDNDQAYVDGQNWLEALETSAIENGAEPERALDDILDDEDVLRGPHPTDVRDRPVADFGSGGRRGL